MWHQKWGQTADGINRVCYIMKPGLEKFSTKKPGAYVFGLVLFTVLVFLLLPQNMLWAASISDTDRDSMLSSLSAKLQAVQQINGSTISSSNKNSVIELLSQASADLSANPSDTTLEYAQVAITEADNILARAGLGQAVQQSTTPAAKQAALRDLNTSVGVEDNTPTAELTIINCSFPSFFSSLGFCTIWSIGQIVFKILSWIVILSATLFGYAVTFNLNIAQYLGQTGGVQLVWSTIRDLANILFIFFLLWLSVQTILGLDDAKKHLPSIIIAALLINFSMFFTRVIIDTSNIVALQFYSGIVQGADDDIGVNVLRATGLNGLYNPSSGELSQPDLLSQAGNKTNLLVVIVLGSIFLLITAFALLNAAFLFVARVLVLVILLATSPIAFVLSILPAKMKQLHSMWWGNLWDQVLVAPIFMLMLWITLKISSSLTSGASGSSFFSALNPGSTSGGSAMGVIFNFLLIIGFLIATVKVTKMLSGQAGSMITTAGGVALGAVAGGVGGWALRGSVGKLSHMAARSEKLKDWSESSGVKGFAGRMALSTAKFGQKSSFDARAVGDTRIGKVAGAVTGAAGVGVGFGKAGGEGGRKAAYDKAVKEKESSRKEEAEAIKTEKLDMLANPLGDAKITAENARRKTVNEQRAKDEVARLEKFAQRTSTGTILDKVKNVATLSATATKGSIKAAGGVAKDLKKKQDQEKNLKSRSDRIEGVKTALGAAGVPGMTKDSMDADVIAYFQSKVKSADDDLERKLTSTTPPASGEIEKAEKLVRLYKGKLNEFESDMKERDRLGEALGKKPDEKKP